MFRESQMIQRYINIHKYDVYVIWINIFLWSYQSSVEFNSIKLTKCIQSHNQINSRKRQTSVHAEVDSDRTEQTAMQEERTIFLRKDGSGRFVRRSP